MRKTMLTGAGRERRFREPGGYEGYEVHDPLGKRIGRAEKVFVNGDGDPRHVRVRLRFFGKSVLIPVEGIGANPELRTLVLLSSAR